ncbi:MAG: DNA repair protein RecN [Candidatus Marinimicrobia bacterium]|jgi:DNA repair protein RecN (Recombination protein N)|nr:DNA repair protein RecN [Candidatus Neomarinimicrobiota bacterium]MBT3937531.1 DNA repair protein RecN [Candidatus Neomarinimicrobiota bacterium]MBT3961137.1 DNA repair protein RecN [Candidatus Neomarinimicrobiota bacterium]MBT4384020.1 DNA repair protein RecN [Candidatus Neomarinimicrobiota bacterium]MBT4636975.1 DNA repair protein RecN [Candidatus Neomarinimicrobiota bacterium]
MINQLSIKNYAIIDELSLPFYEGLTVVTGETGSGKSILLQAMSVALGGKTSKIMVRSHESRAVVEASSNQGDFRRIITSNGHQKSFINDEPTAIDLFRNQTQYLADFHGQHEQQVILKKDSHIDYLDRYGNLEADSIKVQDLYQLLQLKRKQLKNAILSSQERKDRLELIQFQLQEIQAVNPELGEDISLDNAYRKMVHQEEILTTLQSTDGQLSQNSESIQNQLSSVKNQIEKLCKYDSQLGILANTIDSALISVQDVSSGISDYLVNLDHDPDQLIEVQDRLNAIEGLKRKYGGQLEMVLEKKEDIEKEIQTLYSASQSVNSLYDDIEKLESDYRTKATFLHDKRIIMAKKLAKDVIAIMENLNMPHAQFESRVTLSPSKDSFITINNISVNSYPKGIDQVEFYLSANPGEQLKPLTNIASGGETSRIMLAFKTVFQKKDMVETLIFDEIDTGISGETAEKVADCLRKLARDKQVFCISHLPQITRKADFHLHVSKSVDNNQTHVEASYLDKEKSEIILNQFFNSQI